MNLIYLVVVSFSFFFFFSFLFNLFAWVQVIGLVLDLLGVLVFGKSTTRVVVVRIGWDGTEQDEWMID